VCNISDCKNYYPLQCTEYSVLLLYEKYLVVWTQVAGRNIRSIRRSLHTYTVLLHKHLPPLIRTLQSTNFPVSHVLNSQYTDTPYYLLLDTSLPSLTLSPNPTQSHDSSQPTNQPTRYHSIYQNQYTEHTQKGLFHPILFRRHDNTPQQKNKKE
jgi:hypothetical protein